MLKPAQSAPASEQELMDRAFALAGFSLGELAEFASVKVPDNFQREKGWSGQLIELFLGATAGSKPTQDFPHLGIELKTIPIDHLGKPLESTYVCKVPMRHGHGQQWNDSSVKNKLNRVLWVPIQGDRKIPPAERRLGTAILWTPNPEESKLLQQDWEEHMEKIALGEIDTITAHQGEVLQIRPKAANASITTEGIGDTGAQIQTLPRGFYLRARFTQQILLAYY